MHKIVIPETVSDHGRRALTQNPYSHSLWRGLKANREGLAGVILEGNTVTTVRHLVNAHYNKMHN